MLTNICVRGTKRYGVVIYGDDNSIYPLHKNIIYPDSTEAYWMLRKRGLRYDIKKWFRIID